MKSAFITPIVGVLVTTVALGYEIQQSNLKDANASISEAIHHVEDARGGVTGKFGGHAAKALDDLKHAQQELIEGDKFAAAHGNK
jgi:hypothetical protein